MISDAFYMEGEMRLIISFNACAIIAVHNHPSGDPTPSPEDRTLTTRLREAGDLLGIRLLDHLISFSVTTVSIVLQIRAGRCEVPAVVCSRPPLIVLLKHMTPVDTFGRFQVPITSGGLLLTQRTPKK